ncbi:MAG: hypothetical protein ACRDDH_16870 [Cetobacterium sp.]|uniref:hypothetical protein n=1 Tax=Cetobacterium sp. TaxID=2071632 RepID=UPI003EE5B1F7
MKKILLIILSFVTTQIYGNDENIKNQIGENLKVDVKFTLPKEIIKYVVFASKDNGKSMDDTLNLPDFMMSQDSSKAGFIEPPPKVYVKRIVGEEVVDLSSTEKVTYILNHIDGFMPTVLADTIKEGSTSYRQITGYLAKSTLENIIEGSGIKGYSISQSGSIVKTGSSPLQAYYPAAQINMKNNDGVLETTSPKNNYSFSIPSEDISKIEAYIGSGKPLGNVSLKVVVQ